MGDCWGNRVLFLIEGDVLVNLEDFSEICGVNVTPGDLRRLFTTEIAHSHNKVLLFKFLHLYDLCIQCQFLYISKYFVRLFVTVRLKYLVTLIKSI